MTHPAPSTIALTGASGFVGRELARQLLDAGYSVRALVRDRAKARAALPSSPKLTLIVGDILDPGRAAELVRGCSACINLIGILREGPEGQTFRKVHVESTRALVAACETSGVKRFFQMSALGASDMAACDYQKTKYEAELIVRASNLAWTIFRPGVIHGLHSEFIGMVAGFASGLEPPYFFLPYFTRGHEDKRIPLGGEEQHIPIVAPIAVEDVALAFVAALANPVAIGEVYNLVGPERFKWPEVLTIIRDGSGGNPHLHPWGIPAKAASIGAHAAKKLGLGGLLPFDEGMPIMAAQDCVSEMNKVRHHLGIWPRPFRSTFANYAARLDEVLA